MWIHTSKFEKGKRFSITANSCAYVKWETRRLKDDNETEENKRHKEEHKQNSSHKNIETSLHDSSPSGDTDGPYFYKRDATDEINMSIMFWGFIKIACVAIDSATYLTVFKESFSEFIREIVREDNHFINFIFLDYFMVFSYGS